MPMAKDVFELLHENRTAEALVISKSLYAEAPSNVWNLRALIRSLCKAIWEPESSEQARLYAEELKVLPALPPGDNDSKLTEQREHAIQKADPLSQKLWAIRDLSKNGLHGEAIAQLRQLHRDNLARHDVDESLAWEIFHSIVEALRDEEPDKERIRNLLLEYVKLSVAKPSAIYSRILDVAARAAHGDAFPNFCGFLKWWGIENLREEDFQSKPSKDGKPFPSVVAQVIQGLGKVLKKEANQALVCFASGFISDHYEKFPEQEWFPYYMALAHLRSGRSDDALALLIPTVRKKQTEAWAWHHLAECFERGNVARLACLCRAVLCGSREPEHLLPLRMDLAAELLAVGYKGEAKHEIETVVQVRTMRKWPIRGELLELTRAEWFRDSAAKDGVMHYREWALSANDVLTRGLPWLDAVLGVKNVTFPERKDRFAIVDVRYAPETVMSIPVKMKAFALLAESTIGKALAVQLDDASEKPSIIGLRVRDGDCFDILAKTPAMVLRGNSEKGVTVLLTVDGVELFCYHTDLPFAQSLSPGAIVQCTVVLDAKRKAVRFLDVYHGCVSSVFWKEYRAAFRAREIGGGHAGDVFVHARLSGGLDAGCAVHGVAVRREDTATKRVWWEAISAEQVSGDF